MQSDNTTRHNPAPTGAAVRKGRTALVTTALALGIGSLVLANPAAARDEFKNAFEFELGRIVAHEVAAVGHAILTPHVALHREVYRAPGYYSYRSPHSHRHPHHRHYRKHSHARPYKHYRSCRHHYHRHDRHHRYSRRDHRMSDRRHRHDHRSSERRDRYEDRVRDHRDERTSHRRHRHDY